MNIVFLRKVYLLIIFPPSFHSQNNLDKEFKESLVVQKVLRSLPLRYDAKVSSIEETRDLRKMTMDELHGILATYEMITYT
jgi:hypothetical protein